MPRLFGPVFALTLLAPVGALGATTFDPIPTSGTMSHSERIDARYTMATIVAREERTTPDRVALGEVKMWERASGAGWIACVEVLPDSGHQRYVAVISISQGPLKPTPVVVKAQDNDTYTRLGCNTPSPVMVESY